MPWRPSARIVGQLRPPGDKSIGHRLALLGALARGKSRIRGFPPGEDCRRTLALVQSLGVEVSQEGDTVEILGVGIDGLRASAHELDAGNSGTTARMACGLLAAQAFDSRIVGDESLSRRPFDRVTRPLVAMGAEIETQSGRLPVDVHGGRALRAIDYLLPIPSAQVKTAVLLAGLYASGRTTVRESHPSRNHTELALRSFGVALESELGSVTLSPPVDLVPRELDVPGDISSAAFFIGAAAALPGSTLSVRGVGLNDTRTGFLDVLRSMGASIEEHVGGSSSGNEPYGDLLVTGRELHGARVDPARLPAMIDEIPMLAVVATLADGETVVTGASELRVKESDRLSAIVDGLRALGADIDPLDDGFVVRGGRSLRPAHLHSHGDHRMVMAWAMASLMVGGRCTIDHLDQVKISYPAFWDALERLTRSDP